MHILFNAIYNGLLLSVILKNELKRNVISNNSWHYFVNDVTKHVFLNGEGLQTLILGIFTTKMLHKERLEMLFILLAI